MRRLTFRVLIKDLICCLCFLLILGTSFPFSYVVGQSEKSKEAEPKKLEKLFGKVTDSYGNAIPNALICVYGHPSIGARTDSAGRFVLDFHAKNKFGLCVDHVCYCGKNILIQPRHVKNELNVVLNENVAQIDLITENVNPYGCEKRLKMPILKMDFEEEEALIVMELPEFRGGIKNFLKIFKQEKQNVLSSLKASGQDLKGMFHGTFVVDKTGYINKVTLDEKASSIIQETIEEIFGRTGKWKPGIQMGTPVDVKYSFVVEF